MHGVSLKLVDKNVDKILLNSGYEKPEIFYSPITSLIAFWGMLISMILLPLTLLIIDILFSKPSIFIAVLLYMIIGYLVVSILNRSFAITDKELLVINSHFPFCGIESYKLEEISDIKISSSWALRLLIIFGFGNNYIKVKTKNQEKKFYCLFLEVDCYDENWTEKTLDDLENALKLKRINVKLEI